MNLWQITLTMQIIHLFYHQMTTLIDLYPFNNIRGYRKKEQLLEAGVNGLTMGFPIVALLSGNKILMSIAVGLLGILCLGEFFTWWYPYLFGATEYWQKQYDQKFKSTIIILPSIKNNPIPNLEHLILHILTLITFIMTALLAYKG